MSGSGVIPIERLEFTLGQRPWPFAQARRADIDAHFARLRESKPALWNGRVLLLDRHEMSGGTLRGSFIETDFASFLAWRDWGFPDTSVVNCFAQGALRTTDGAFLLGVMGDHTANAGGIYFPSGTPEPRDVSGTSVDLDASVRREVEEETGLAPGAYDAESVWHAVPDGPRLALIRVLRVPVTADALREQILGYLRPQAEPELADIRIVRGPDEIDPMMPAYVTTFLRAMWSEGRR